MNLFQENGVTVTSICLKHKGDKVFAFAKISSEDDMLRAIKTLDSKEIHGQRLRSYQLRVQPLQMDKEMERAPFQIFIGNYPVEFDENDLMNLFQENGVPVTKIRLQQNGLKVFAFAETLSEADIQTAIKTLDSK